MRFINLYEAGKKIDEEELQVIDNNTSKKYFFKRFTDAFKSENTKEIMNILNCIHNVGNNNNKSSKQKAFNLSYIDKDAKKKYATFIEYNRSNTNIISPDFEELSKAIKVTNNWENLIKNVLPHLEQQDLIKFYFLPRLKEPTKVPEGKNDNKGIPSEEDYRKFGKAMVFYSAKCASRLTDIDTKIDDKQFKTIMQGVFGAMAASKSTAEDESYLDQFITLQDKMHIDAAKIVVYNISNKGVNDFAYKNVQVEDEDSTANENYYNSINAVLAMLNEADANVSETDNIKFPNKITDFSKNKAIAFKQASFVAKKYPHDYKIAFETLRNSFDNGVKDYQDKLRALSNNEMGNAGKIELENPITNKIEKLSGRVFGMGGPNGYINEHPTLKKHCDAIKQDKWTIYNLGPKLILGLFDLLEKSGKAYQTFCDGLGQGLKQMKRSLQVIKGEDFIKHIKEVEQNSEAQPSEPVEENIAYVVWAFNNLIEVLSGNNEIATIDCNNFTYTDKDNKSIINIKLQDFIKALDLFVNEVGVQYLRKSDEVAAAEDEKIKAASIEVEKLKNNEFNEDDDEEDESEQTDESYKKHSFLNFLNEEENNTEKKKEDIKTRIEKAEKSLEKLKEVKDEKLGIKLNAYAMILNTYKDSLSNLNEIETLQNNINKIFPEDENDLNDFVYDNTHIEEDEESDDEEKDNTELPTVENVNIKKLRLLEAEGDDEEYMDDSDDAEKSYKYNDEIATSYNDLKTLLNFMAGDENKLYEIFDMRALDGLTKSSTVKDGIKKMGSVFKSTLEKLKKLNINPIIDGGVKVTNEIAEDLSKDYFKILLKDESKEENKKDNEKEENKKEDEPETKNELEEFNKKLEEDVGENGIIMGYIKNLNNIVRQSANDKWLTDVFEKNSSELQNHIKERFGDFYKMYDSETAHKWLTERYNEISNYTYATKLWAAVSTFKFIHNAVKKHLDNQKTENKKLIFIEPKLYESYNTDYINEAENQQNMKYSKEKIDAFVKQTADSISTMDFNELLGLSLNPGDAIYDITNSAATKSINDKETALAEKFGVKHGNHVAPEGKEASNFIGRMRYIANNENSPYRTVIQEKCSNLLGVLVPKESDETGGDNASMSKNVSTKDDRDIIKIAGAIHGICVVVGNISPVEVKNNKTDEIDNSSNDKKTATANNINNMTDSKIVNSTFNTETLLNEIYKYIRG